MEMNAVRAYNYTLTVAGHRSQNGFLWAPDCCVNVTDEKHGINGVHYILGRELTVDKNQGAITNLKLIPAGIWLALDHDSVSDSEYNTYIKNRIWW